MSPIAEVNRRLLSPGGLPMGDVHQSESEQLLSRQQQLLDQLAHVAGSREVKGTVPELTADAQRVQQILKSAGADIELLRTRAGGPVDVEGVHSDLQQAAEALDRLELQVTASRRIAAEARELALGVQELISGRSVSPVRFLDLTNRICEAEQADGGKSFLVGMNDTAVWEIADVGCGIDPSVLAQGILCAHLSSLIGPAVGNVVRSSNDRTQILAALLQDVGMVCLPRRRSHHSEPSADNSEPSADNSEPSAEGDVKTKRLHPLWSAALVQGIRHSGQELPRLVAEHHENLLGCGFPHGLRARQLTPRSRFLAVVSSFVERVRAVLQPARESGLCEALRLENAVESGCRTLAERVRFGELDPRITTAFLEQVRMLSQVERSRFDSTPQTADSTPPFRNSLVERIPEKTDVEESAVSPIHGLRPPDGAPPKPKFLRRFNRASVNVLFSQQGSTGAAKSPGRLISVLNPNAE